MMGEDDDLPNSTIPVAFAPAPNLEAETGKLQER
jgi:hypothetical protein